ncbi:polyketide synthase [Nemania sp. FL0031]|nr:polyketide synthase [Nemania sp. FL0031]
MAALNDVYVFGDQSIPILDKLQRLLHVKDNALLSSFVNESFLAVRQETNSLSSIDRQSIPQAENLGLLLEIVGKSAPHAALDSCFLCIYEIGYYLEYLYRSKRQHPPASTTFLGICTGGLAAAAISCSQNVFEIPRLGVQSVTVAFRTGMQVSKRAGLLGYSLPESWSMTISSSQEDRISEHLESFSINMGLATAMRPYISAVSLASTTISGPPNILDSLKSLDAHSAHRLNIFGPYHYPHAYSATDLDHALDSALGGIDYLENEAVIPLLSCVSGSVTVQASFGPLLKEMLTNALTKQIRIDRVANYLLEIAHSNQTTIIPVNTLAIRGLVDWVSQQGGNARAGLTLEALANERAEGPLRSHASPTPEDARKIAIIGYSGRFPEADNLDEFWDLLIKGQDVHKPIPEERFAADHYDPTAKRKNTSQIPHGCWLKTAGHFDTKFFHMSPKEAMQTEPAQRVALLTAYEALEMAGVVPDRTPSTCRSRVGVYYGTTSNDWGEVNSCQDIDTYYIPGANRAFIPGRINYFFKFTGPSIAVDTACSSSLAAINTAITSLLNGNCDTAVAGGTNVLTNPDNFAGLDRGHFLSRTGNCKAFDDGADGYCRADGVGTLILKRLPDAIADNDPIFGTILGAQTNHSADSVSITRPLSSAQEYLFKKLLTESGIHPHDVGYVEMHGTGTQEGDAAEMRSVLNSFAFDHSRPQQKQLWLGSVKANVGHAESASGVIAVIKVLLMMQKSKIPPHCGIKTKINHGFPSDLEQRGVRISLGGDQNWPRPLHGKRSVLINNFSAAGGNTSLLLEDAPTTPEAKQHPSKDLQTNHVVVVSARSTKALEENLRNLEVFVADTWALEGELLSQLSYTTTARRVHHRLRVAFVTNQVDDLRRSLFAASTQATEVKPIPSVAPKVGFLFTGQGAQETAMAHGYYKRFSSFRSEIRELDSAARLQGLPSILPLVQGTAPVEELSVVIVQLGTCIIQIALARFWISLGIKPSYVIGHSLGEYAALHISGVLNVIDTIYLCGRRAALLERLCTANTHGMVAVSKASADALQQQIPSSLAEVSCINGTQDIVLSGSNANIDVLCGKLAQMGHKFHKLDMPFAFHSSQVDVILDELEESASSVTFRKPDVPMVSTLLAEVISSSTINPQYIRRHCRETVDFLGAIQTAQDNGLMDPSSMCIEIGAHPILTRMVKSIVGQDIRCCATLRRREDHLRTLADSLCTLHLAGLPVNWDEYHRDFSSSYKVLPLPKYSWQLENYWMQYKHSWCLTKGDDPTETAPADRLMPMTRRPVRLTDSVHDIVEQSLSKERSFVTMESDMHDSALFAIAENHRVNGLTMAPSTLFSDVAFTLARHLMEKHGPEMSPLMPAINNMAIEKALVVKETGPQLFRASLEVDWTTMHGSMEIYSVDELGKRTALHGRCDINIEDPRVYRERWQSHAYLIERSIAQLHEGVFSSTAQSMRRGMLYKMFSASVQYGSPFQGIKQVWFDSQGLEGTAEVFLPSGKHQFTLNPYCCDSLGHLTGFIMNCSDSLDLNNYVYVNHGWRYLQMTEPYQCDVQYQTHVKMRAAGSDDSEYIGDVHVLRDGEVIAICGGVTFRKVSRKVLERLLGSPLTAKTRAKAPQAEGLPEPVRKSTPVLPSALPSAMAPNVSSTAAPVPVPEPAKSQISKAPDLLSEALKILADEIGVEMAQLTDSTLLADIGVDSLMSLTILGSFREELDLDIPAAQFYDCVTVKELKNFIIDFAEVSDDSPLGSTSGTETYASTSASEAPSPIGQEIAIDKGAPRMDATIGKTGAITFDIPRSTSTILQGTKQCAKTLFLFPDGAGSATSYVTLPAISPSLRVIGLNSPYLTKPREFKCALQDITGSYLTELRRRQPKGPYHLAGWSAGGVSAFDAARQLVAEGEVVESLILIDSPNPVGLGKLPKRMYDFLEKSGIFGAFEMGEEAAAPPDWLFQHFCVFIEALDRYEPQPFVRGQAPRTTIIWAADGVCKHLDDPRPEAQPDDPRGMNWLLDNRSDFGPCGWDEFIGAQNISTFSMPGANHFTMMREPSAWPLCDRIRGAVGV